MPWKNGESLTNGISHRTLNGFGITNAYKQEKGEIDMKWKTKLKSIIIDGLSNTYQIVMEGEK